MQRTFDTFAIGRAVPWAGFFTLCALAWLGLFALSLDHPKAPALGALDPAFDATFWQMLCAVSPAAQGISELVAMWVLMCAAMMVPSASSLLAAYRQLNQGRPGAALGFFALAGGYLSVWIGFAAVAAVVQRALAQAALLSPHGVSVSLWLTAVLLAGAGLYQFSAFKAACLSRCRSPFAFLISHWRAGAAGAFRLGLRHGAICAGCCWALMTLAFVGGAMNLIWMGGAMVLMIVEKLPVAGPFLTRPLGFVLLVAAAGVTGRAIGV